MSICPRSSIVRLSRSICLIKFNKFSFLPGFFVYRSCFVKLSKWNCPKMSMADLKIIAKPDFWIQWVCRFYVCKFRLNNWIFEFEYKEICAIPQNSFEFTSQFISVPSLWVASDVIIHLCLRVVLSETRQNYLTIYSCAN